jgi:hypothetical protein
VDGHHLKADLRSSPGWTCLGWRAICGMTGRFTELGATARPGCGILLVDVWPQSDNFLTKGLAGI